MRFILRTTGSILRSLLSTPKVTRALYLLSLQEKCSMISQVEIQVLNLVYRNLCSKIMRTPFYWQNGRIYLKSKYGGFQNAWITCLLFFELVRSLVQLSRTIDQRNINGSILRVIYLLRYFAHFLLRINTWIFKSELIQVINQCLEMNSSWGNNILVLFHLIKLIHLCACNILIVVVSKFPNTSLSSWSKIRGWIFASVMVVASLSVVLVSSFLIFKVHKEFMNYEVPNTYDWLIIHILYILAVGSEILLMIDCIILGQTTVASIYMGCFTMKYWLRQVW